MENLESKKIYRSKSWKCQTGVPEWQLYMRPRKELTNRGEQGQSPNGQRKEGFDRGSDMTDVEWHIWKVLRNYV